jgi:hypothetical protein
MKGGTMKTGLFQEIITVSFLNELKVVSLIQTIELITQYGET